MLSCVSNILQVATKRGDPKKRLNILCAPTHERYEENLAKCNANFYAIRTPTVKDWNSSYAQTPENYKLLKKCESEEELLASLPDIPFDLVLSQNKFGQYQILSRLAQILHVPLISLEHTLPVPTWPEEYLKRCLAMQGHLNVFISKYSMRKWGFEEAKVIHHGVDTEVFADSQLPRQDVCLSVVNDWKNRDGPCGFRFWQEASKGLPIRVLGDTPGLSKPASSLDELVEAYNTSSIFLNTSLVSPVPTALLEAMACGCCCISTATCMIPEVIVDGYNGFLCNNPQEMREKAKKMLKDKDQCRELGKNARKTILEKFSLVSFVENWNNAFSQTTEMIPYKEGKFIS